MFLVLWLIGRIAINMPIVIVAMKLRGGLTDALDPSRP